MNRLRVDIQAAVTSVKRIFPLSASLNTSRMTKHALGEGSIQPQALQQTLSETHTRFGSVASPEFCSRGGGTGA